MGRGPEWLLRCGAAEALGASGATVETEVVELTDDYAGETEACFELIRQVSDRVSGAIKQGAFPVVLSGSCFLAALGVVAGLDEEAPGVAWFDAHPDFSTPETITDGYLDSMGLAILVGDAWQGMLATIPGAHPVPDTAVVLAGARAMEDDQVVRLQASAIKQVPSRELSSSGALASALEALAPRLTGLYLHIDLDVLDAEEAQVNIYSVPDGITADQLVSRVEDVLESGLVKAMSLTAYDPEVDRENRVAPVVDRLLRAAVA